MGSLLSSAYASDVLASIYKVDFTAIGPEGEVFPSTIHVANVADAELAMTAASEALMARSIVPLADGSLVPPVAIQFNAVKPVTGVAATGDGVLNVTIEQRVRVDGEGLLLYGTQIAARAKFTVFAVVTRDFATAAQEARQFALANLRIPDPENEPAIVAPHGVAIVAIEEVEAIPIGVTLVRP